MYVVAYYIVFAMRNESTMVNSENLDLVLLFYIAMHDPTIYMSFLPPRVTSNVYRYYHLPLNVYSQIPISAVRYSASLITERKWVRIPLWAIAFHVVILAFFAWQTTRISQYK